MARNSHKEFSIRDLTNFQKSFPKWIDQIHREFLNHEKMVAEP